VKCPFTVLCGSLKDFFQELIFPKGVHIDKYFPFISNTLCLVIAGHSHTLHTACKERDKKKEKNVLYKEQSQK